MPIRSDEIKHLARTAGADLCGIAPVDRFDGAPDGFHPRDIDPEAKSVVVLTIQFPEGPFRARTMVSYTAMTDGLEARMTGLLGLAALAIERRSGLPIIPMPGEPYEYWDADACEGRGNLSLKHAGWLAGLGVMGRNSLLVTPRFGNRIVLGALLLPMELESDPIIDQDPCPKGCQLCMENCPGQAIAGGRVNQMRCRSHSMQVTPKGYALYTRFRCRTVCPNARGLSLR